MVLEGLEFQDRVDTSNKGLELPYNMVERKGQARWVEEIKPKRQFFLVTPCLWKNKPTPIRKAFLPLNDLVTSSRSQPPNSPTITIKFQYGFWRRQTIFKPQPW
jgi:hypothetical protein